LLVVDGASTDGTQDIIRRYGDHIAWFVSEPDNGQSHAINKGFCRATGDIVGWLNADDVLFPGALRALADNADADWLVGRCLVIDRDDRQLGEAPRALPRGIDRWQPDAWLEYTCARWTGATIGPASFWSRRALETVGPLDESLHYTMDSNYWIRLFAAGFFPRLIDDVMVGYRRHGAQKSDGSRAIPWCWELVKMQRRLRPLALDLRQRQRLTAYRAWTVGHRLPRTCAVRALERVKQR
jgi:glycosyltransferase involved in cell wall biosynthesis